MTTNKGINIGSLFIIDNVVRPRLSADQQSFLGSVAQIIMKHLEMSRDAQERKKAMRMSRGLNAFVEGKSSLGSEGYLPGSSYIGHREERVNGHIDPADSSKSDERTRIRKRDGLTKDRNSRQSKNSSSLSFSMNDESSDVLASGPTHSYSGELPRDVKLSPDHETSQSESDVDISRENLEVDHKTTIARAADLLRQSLDLRDGGGVVYFDTILGFSRYVEGAPTSPTKQDMAVDINSEDESSTFVRRNSLVVNSTAFRHESIDSIFEAQTPEKLADIISFAVDRPIMGSRDKAQQPASFIPLGEESLQYLLRRYPRGSLWSFDEDGSLSSSEEEVAPSERAMSSHRKARIREREYIASMLLKHFPGGEYQNSKGQEEECSRSL